MSVRRIEVPNPATAGSTGAGKAATPSGGPSFAEVLQRKMGLRLSAHAQNRLSTRGIQITEAQWSRIGEAVERAAQKGAREALIVLPQAALVIGVPQRTVITVVDRQSLQENLFTQIDSAVLL